ncbi:hypothetical protein [Rhizobium ruizarguesonis]|uniref:hypothetical protein n=1 Tax=Rhizobium ruizarguesonis TaxID=2081791 RepID=UPI0013C019AF|nr:hypothetical protein [Rhizobium ruizarguesonis]NEJ02590.1 hypothetical protein [Rhizobium ruizarguesonis]NEJ39718.1 hypothetical protein [Rhizobium ruizarguesonis]
MSAATFAGWIRITKPDTAPIRRPSIGIAGVNVQELSSGELHFVIYALISAAASYIASEWSTAA